VRLVVRLFVVGILAWALLIAGWWITVSDGDFVDTRVLIALPALAVGVVALTAWWVRHNRAIYRRKGPRLAAPPGTHDWRYDRLGRLVLADEQRLRKASIVAVSVNGSFKRFDAWA
jgi:hypothetical protein